MISLEEVNDFEKLYRKISKYVDACYKDYVKIRLDLWDKEFVSNIKNYKLSENFQYYSHLNNTENSDYKFSHIENDNLVFEFRNDTDDGFYIYDLKLPACIFIGDDWKERLVITSREEFHNSLLKRKKDEEEIVKREIEHHQNRIKSMEGEIKANGKKVSQESPPIAQRKKDAISERNRWLLQEIKSSKDELTKLKSVV